MVMPGSLGINWAHNFDTRLTRFSNRLDIVTFEGLSIQFLQTNNVWQQINPLAIPFQLVESGTNYVLGDPRDNRLYTFDQAGELIAIADGKGNVQTLTYTNNVLVAVSDGLGRTLTLTYEGFEQLASVTDGTRTVSFGYWFFNTLYAVTNTLGGVTTYNYDFSRPQSALLTEKVLPQGNARFVHTYDSSGRVTSQVAMGLFTNWISYLGNTTITTNALGLVRTYTHSPNGELSSYTDETNQTVTVFSNTNGQRSAIRDRLGNITGMAYHPASGRLAALTNAAGGITRYAYSSHTVSGITFYDLSQITFPDGATESFTYDPNGNLTNRTDRAGNHWSYTYNNRGQVLTAVNPLGGTTTYTYNADGTPASMTDSDLPGATVFGYDGLRRLTNWVHPDGSSASLMFDLEDRVASISDEQNHTYTYAYDANGNVTNIMDPNALSSQFAYDAMDKVIRITDHLGNSETMGYDALGNLLAITNRNGNRVRLAYDAVGRLSQLTDGGGRGWKFGFNNEDVFNSFGNPLGQTDTRRIDPLGLSIGATNALGNTRQFTRDGMSRLTQFVDELSKTSFVYYDSRGLATNRTRPRVGSVSLSRDAAGWVRRLTDLNGHSWLFSLSPKGRLLSRIDPLGHTNRYAYNSRGQLASETVPDGVTRSNTYDASGNLTRSRYSDGTDLQFQYDSLGRLTNANGFDVAYDPQNRITNTLSTSVGFGAGWDPGGRLISASYNSGAFQVHYAYDSRDRLISVSDTLTGTQMTFGYDDGGRLTNIVRANGVNGLYDYDAAGRLTRLREGSIIDLQYTRDAAGQPRQVSVLAPLDPASYVPADSNWTFDAASQISSSGYTYDPRGRLIRSPGHTFGWDGASRLTGIDSVTLTYDAADGLVTRTAGGITNRFFYNHALGGLVAERNDNTGQFLRYYVRAPGGSLLYLIDASNNNVYYYHFDQAGSTLALTASNGNVTDAYAYSQYGQVLGRTGSNPQPFLYVGRFGVRSEPAAGLYQMGFRYYDPASARFLSRDPLWPKLSDPQSLNPYQYAANNPLQNLDPSGLDFNIATGLKWVPLRYTFPAGVGADSPNPNGPDLGQIYGWQTTSLDNYIAFFPIEQVGIQLSLDLGYASQGSGNESVGKLASSYFQLGLGLGAKFYLNTPARERVSPYLFVNLFKYFASLSSSDPLAQNDVAAAIAALNSPLGADIAFGAEYFYTTSFSLGAEVLGVRFAHVEGQIPAPGESVSTGENYLLLYTAISLNYRFLATASVHTYEEEEDRTNPQRPSRRKRPLPPPEDPPPDQAPPASPESVD
jgi:RHS repeat-associated protein